MGLETNRAWVHSIRQDNRPPSLKSPEELAFESQRISLTFRKINTFLSLPADQNQSQAKIYGQGATGKTPGDAKMVINGDKEEADKMIFAFSKENKSANFDWDENYGRGFDVLHFTVVEHVPSLHNLDGNPGLCIYMYCNLRSSVYRNTSNSDNLSKKEIVNHYIY